MILEFHRDHDPGAHTIFLEDTEIGRISGDPEVKLGVWKVIERHCYDHTAPTWDLGIHEFPTLKDAKVYIAHHIRKCYPGLEEVRQ